MNITTILLSIGFHFFASDTIPVIAGYKPASFSDDDRMLKLKPLMPVIEKMYADYANQNEIPGLTFGIVVDGQLISSGAMGYSDAEKKTPVTAASVYRIASMSKSFAGLAILRLRDEGKLRLDDPVTRFIPELKDQPRLTDDSPPITIRHLVSHTAGFPEDNPWGDRQLQDTDKEFLDFLRKKLSLSNIPGMAYEYSNLGFTMLGLIITRASGQHYEKYIRNNIFKPLGMNHTYWEYDEVPKDLLVNGYRTVNGKWTKEEMLHSGAYGIMGGMLTSIDDFAKYMSLHMSAWPARSGKDTGIIKRSSLREMHMPGNVSNLISSSRNARGLPCPRINSYNFGLAWSKDCEDKLRVSHSGGLPGFGTNWIFMPDYGIGVVSFCNLTYAASAALNNRILDTLIMLADLKPRKIAPSLILEQRKNELLKFLPGWSGAESSGIFAENFFADYFVDSLKKESKTLFEKAGRIGKVSEMMPDNQLRGNFLLEGENSDILIRFTLSPENPALIQYFSQRLIPKRNKQ
jgi:CubicO group peptidase (beta-lactamase class C family)